MVNSTSPLLTTASSFTSSAVIRPTTSGTTWIVLAVTIASVVRGRTSRRCSTRTASPIVTTSARGSTARAKAAFALSWPAPVSISVSIPAEPGQRRDRERDAGIEDQRHAHELVRVKHGHQLERDDRARDADQGAQHPGREERAEDVERGAVHIQAATS